MSRSLSDDTDSGIGGYGECRSEGEPTQGAGGVASGGGQSEMRLERDIGVRENMA